MGRKTATNRDQIFDLIALHRRQQSESLAQITDAESDRLAGIASATWWRLLDTGPASMEGAQAYSEYVAQQEKEKIAPTIRTPGDDSTEENVCLIALERVAAFLKREV